MASWRRSIGDPTEAGRPSPRVELAAPHIAGPRLDVLALAHRHVEAGRDLQRVVIAAPPRPGTVLEHGAARRDLDMTDVERLRNVGGLLAVAIEAGAVVERVEMPGVLALGEDHRLLRRRMRSV